MAPDGDSDKRGIDIQAVLQALKADDLDALREALDDRWWTNQLRQSHFRSPDGERVVSAYGIWKEHNSPHGFVDSIGPPDDSNISLGGPQVLLNGEAWERLSDEEVLRFYAAKDDTTEMGFLLTPEDS